MAPESYFHYLFIMGLSDWSSNAETIFCVSCYLGKEKEKRRKNYLGSFAFNMFIISCILSYFGVSIIYTALWFSIHFCIAFLDSEQLQVAWAIP